MAANGKTTSFTNYNGIDVTYRQTSQNVAGNTSTITATIEHYSTAWSSWASNSTVVVVVNGVSKSINIPPWNWGGANRRTIGTLSFTVTHSSNGSMSVSIYHDWRNGGYNQASSTNRMTLDTIPRASSIGNLTGTQIGSSMTVSISRKSSSFTHQVWYRLPGQAWQNMGTGHTTSCSFTIPLSQCSFIPNSTNGKVEIAVQTKSGSSNIGAEVRKSFTVYVPSYVVPSFSTITASEGNSAVGMFAEYIQNLSRLKLAITGASGIYGSTIKSYRIEVDKQVLNAQSGITQTILSSGRIPVIGTVVDSRNRSIRKTVYVTIVPYAFPQIKNYSFRRTRQNGDIDELGTYVRVDFTISFSSLVLNGLEQNTFGYAVDSKEIGVSNYTQKVLKSGAVSYKGSEVIGIYELNKPYDFRLRAIDRFNTTMSLGVISRGVASAQIFDDGMAVGMVTDQFTRNLYVGGKGIKSEGPIVDKNEVQFIALGGTIVEYDE